MDFRLPEPLSFREGLVHAVRRLRYRDLVTPGSRWALWTFPFHVASCYTNCLGARLALGPWLGPLLAVGLQLAVMTLGYLVSGARTTRLRVGLAILWLLPLALSIAFSFAGMDHHYWQNATLRDDHLERKKHLSAQADLVSRQLEIADKTAESHLEFMRNNSAGPIQSYLDLLREWGELKVNMDPITTALKDPKRIDPALENAAYNSLDEDVRAMRSLYSRSFDSKWMAAKQRKIKKGIFREPEFKLPERFISGATGLQAGAGDDFLGPLQRLKAQNQASYFLLAIAGALDLLPFVIALAMSMAAGAGSHGTVQVLRPGSSEEAAHLCDLPPDELLRIYDERTRQARRLMHPNDPHDPHFNGNGNAEPLLHSQRMLAECQRSLENIVLAFHWWVRRERLRLTDNIQSSLQDEFAGLQQGIRQVEWEGLAGGMGFGDDAHEANAARRARRWEEVRRLQADLDRMRGQMGGVIDPDFLEAQQQLMREMLQHVGAQRS